jgi:hypothetical protein
VVFFKKYMSDNFKYKLSFCGPKKEEMKQFIFFKLVSM